MNQSLYQFVLERLKQSEGTWPEVARKSGVPYRTLKKIGSGKTPFPRIDTVEKLAEHFRAERTAA